MYFLVDHQKKVIFGWSPKCGCSRAKKIFWFLKNNTIVNNLHTHNGNDFHPLPNDIENYTTIVFSRNPLKRIISGFLDKYKKKGEFRHFWKYDKITFSTFVDELVKNNWNMVNKLHFSPQTGDDYNTNILRSKCLKIFDIEHIDYSFLESLYHKKIPEELLKFDLMGHERKKFNKNFEEPVYDLDMDEYYNSNVDIKYFYNEEIKYKVCSFYLNDFLLFNCYGIKYYESTF